jgi:hypothetical protein
MRLHLMGARAPAVASASPGGWQQPAQVGEFPLVRLVERMPRGHAQAGFTHGTCPEYAQAMMRR